MKDFDKTIGYRIKERRLELGLSQRELADRLGYKAKSAISMIERGERALNASQILPFAEALDCSIDDLLDGIKPTRDAIIDLFDVLDESQQEAVLAFLKATIARR